MASTSEKPDDKAIFNVARQIASLEARADYLHQICGHDPELLHHIEILLRAYEDQQSFLESPAAAACAPTIAAPPVTESPGDSLGPYKLLEQIGEGGFGVVFMAAQTAPIKRRVALKVIKPGMDTRQVIARFEAERQALAMMDHPNIARVLDAGATSSGRPYFVMELVRGVPITQFSDNHQLPLCERLELFVHVCQAVQHAHQKGIIHRDIKPTNVLVTLHDDKPVVKVIDFGVAKATSGQLTEKTVFTGFAQMVGTPLYMSPEQAAMSGLDIDTRSDIYSLGVLIYELLTGTTPFDKQRLQAAAYDEIRRIICDEEPQKPSTRISSLGATLPSAAAMRHTEPAKLSKLVRGDIDWIVMKALEKDRNRRYETANGLAADVQRYLNDEPVQACPPSVEYRLRKLIRRNKASLAAAALVLFFVVFLATVVGWSLRDRAAREQAIAQETTRKRLLTEQLIRQSLARAATSRAELHRQLKRPGGVQELLNQPARWELFLESAAGELAQVRTLTLRSETSLNARVARDTSKLEEQLARDRTEYELALKLEKIRLDVANWEDGAYDYEMATAEYPKALSAFRVLTDDPAGVAARIASSPIRDQLVAALDDWATCAFSLRQEDVAEQLLDVARTAVPESDWGNRVRQLNVWRDPEALDSLVAEASVDGLSPHLCSIIGYRADSTRRVSWLRRAQAAHPGDYWLNFSLANALSQSEPVEAAGYYRVAIAVRPGNNAAYNDLGVLLHRQQKLPEAIACLRKSIENDPQFANGYVNLCLVLLDQGKVDEAVAFGRKGLELDPKHANGYNLLGNALTDQGKIDEAIGCYQKALEIDPKFANAHHNLGISFRRQSDLEKAIACYRAALQIDPQHAKAHDSLGTVYYLQGKLDDAIESHRTAIEISPDLASAHYNLGLVLRKQRKPADSVASLRKSLELRPNYADAHVVLGNALCDLGKTDEGIASYRQAIEIDPKNELALHGLGNALRDLGKLDEAVVCLRQAVELVPRSSLSWQSLGWLEYRTGNWRASATALETSCKLQEGGTGDEYQWIVLALAHAKLSSQNGLSDEEWEHHKREGRRWYEMAVKQIDAWGPGDSKMQQAVRAFRAEAAELLGDREKLK